MRGRFRVSFLRGGGKWSTDNFRRACCEGLAVVFRLCAETETAPHLEGAGPLGSQKKDRMSWTTADNRQGCRNWSSSKSLLRVLGPLRFTVKTGPFLRAFCEGSIRCRI